MLATRKGVRWFVSAGLALLVGLALLWFGATPEDGRPAAPGARAALVGPVAGDSELVVELVVQGRLPVASAPGPVAASESAEEGAGSGSGPGEGEATPPAPTDPLVGAVGARAEPPPASRPGGPGERQGRLREGRTPALREGEPAAGRISDRTLRAILGRKRGSLEACYHGARALDPTLEGGVTFALTVRPAGDVEVDVLERSPALDQAGVTGCIRQKLESLDFTATPPQGGELHLRLPMNFLQVPDSDA